MPPDEWDGGRDSFFFNAPAESREAAAWRRRVLIPGAVAGGAAVLALLLWRGSSPDFIVLVLVLLLFCGLLLFDILDRRGWEEDMRRQIGKLSAHHDRLVREVARNRNDIAALKHGLSRTAHSVERQGRGHAPSDSLEARMLQTIITQLGAMGERAPEPIYPGAGAAGNRILELEMAPPPAAPPPVSALDSELGPDFSQFTDEVVLDLVRHAVRHDHMDVFMQPIVALPQRKPRLFEVFARIRAYPGTYLPAARYLKLAEKEHLVPTIDNLLLLRCLQLLRDRHRSADDEYGDTPYILNISPDTLHDRGFMGDLVSFLSQDRPMAARLVFELRQESLEEMETALQPILDGLSQLGCRFSMDGVRRKRLDIDMLKRRHVRFLKLDAQWLIRESGAAGGAARLIRLKRELDTAGIDLIVEKIENEDTLRALLDFHIDYGQGYLFAKPDSATAWQGRRARS